MKNKKAAPKVNVWTWIHNNRLKIVVLSFFIIVPLALLLTAYIGSYTTNQKVHFDNEVTEETIYYKNFISADEIDAFNLIIVWSELKHPIEVSEDEEVILAGGYYKFNMHYETSDSFTVKSVSVTPILQTDWTNMRSLGSLVNLTNIARPVSINFNFRVPTNPLLFVEVSEPNLYLKVQYVVSSAGTDIEHTQFVKFSLKDLNPLNVIG